MILENYLPKKTGGIENYTHWLAKILSENNHEVEAAYLNIGESDSYRYENISVTRLINRFDSFKELLQQKKYDIYHFQEYSGSNGINIKWFKEAQQYGKVFFTFHLPYLTCYKGDFRHNGIEDCSDFSHAKRCLKCVIATSLNYKEIGSVGIYNFAVKTLSLVIEKTHKGKILEQRIKLRKSDLDCLIDICANIFVIADWFKKILTENGYNSTSIIKIPHITEPIIKAETQNSLIKKRILFVGRIEEQKGLHLLCNAMRRIVNKDIELDVFGNIVDQKYFADCHQAYHFNFKGTLERSELLEMLHLYDFLILPSVFTEMYSMILREACFAKLLVIASSAKGNVDAIKEGKNGFIFKYNDAKDLARVIDNGYKVKKTGWQPEFSLSSDKDEALQKILFYYN